MPPVVLTFAREPKSAPYIEALRLAGLSPENVRRASPERIGDGDPLRLLDGAAGLLLSGGVDIAPRLYGEETAPGVTLDEPSAERDRLEWDLLAEARRRRLPVLAICRGVQVLNAHLGGTLWQDLPVQLGIRGHDRFLDAGHAPDERAHGIDAVPTKHPMGDWLARHPGMLVNSRHHQAVHAVAPGLVVTATAPDGVIEALAAEDPGWWAWGVQWHPENLVADEDQLELFRAFLTATEEEPR